MYNNQPQAILTSGPPYPSGHGKLLEYKVGILREQLGSVTFSVQQKPVNQGSRGQERNVRV